MNGWQQLLRAAEASPRLVIGLMSGTSADGTDAALVRLSNADGGSQIELVAFVSLPFPPGLRESALDVMSGRGHAETISRLAVELAEEYARAVAALRLAADLTSADIVVAIGCHGQTVSHTPRGRFPATLQIGDPSTLALRTRLPVVSNFRSADIAAGGQGAPLTPYADWKLLTHLARSRAVQNVGGIGNVTYLPANGAAEQVVGFDTGPGNMLIDLASEWATDGRSTYDIDGRMGFEGNVLPELLAWLSEHSFLAARPPKSAGREEFGETYWHSALRWLRESRVAWTRPSDVVATVTAYTAHTVATAYADFLPEMPDEVIVCGGGARNPALMHYLTERLSPAPVLTSESVGINPQAREAMAFALLADETLHGRPANLLSVTGARSQVVLGSVTLPG